jgi:hypothetical protein
MRIRTLEVASNARHDVQCRFHGVRGEKSSQVDGLGAGEPNCWEESQNLGHHVLEFRRIRGGLRLAKSGARARVSLQLMYKRAMFVLLPTDSIMRQELVLVIRVIMSIQRKSTLLYADEPFDLVPCVVGTYLEMLGNHNPTTTNPQKSVHRHGNISITYCTIRSKPPRPKC